MKINKKPVLDATDREAVRLVVVVAVDRGVAVVQVPSPRVTGIVLRGRPQVGVVAAIVESETTLIVVAVAGGEALTQ